MVEEKQDSDLFARYHKVSKNAFLKEGLTYNPLFFCGDLTCPHEYKAEIKVKRSRFISFLEDLVAGLDPTNLLKPKIIKAEIQKEPLFYKEGKQKIDLIIYDNAYKEAIKRAAENIERECDVKITLLTESKN